MAKQEVKRLLSRKTLSPRERALLVVGDTIEKLKTGKPLLKEPERAELIDNWRAKTYEEANEYNKYINAWGVIHTFMLFGQTRAKSAEGLYLIAQNELTRLSFAHHIDAIQKLAWAVNMSAQDFIKDKETERHFIGLSNLIDIYTNTTPLIKSLDSFDEGWGELKHDSKGGLVLSDKTKSRLKTTKEGLELIYGELLAYDKLFGYLSEIYNSEIDFESKDWTKRVSELIAVYNSALKEASGDLYRKAIEDTIKECKKDKDTVLPDEDYQELIDKTLSTLDLSDYQIDKGKIKPRYKDNEPFNDLVSKLDKHLGSSFDIKKLLG